MKKLLLILALLGLGHQGQAAFTRVIDPSQIFDYVDEDGIRVTRTIGADSLTNSAPAQALGVTWGELIATPGLSPTAQAIIIWAMPGFSTASNSLRVGLTATAGNPTPMTLGYGSQSDTYAATGTGAVLSATARPLKSFALAVKGTGAAPTSFTVLLQGSLDGTNWTTILTASNITPGDGQVQWAAAGIATPAIYFRTNTTALVLGSATDIVVRLLGLQ